VWERKRERERESDKGATKQVMAHPLEVLNKRIVWTPPRSG